VIIDMMLVHYRNSITPLFGISMVKVIDYTDFAMEGFVVLAGYMIGLAILISLLRIEGS